MKIQTSSSYIPSHLKRPLPSNPEVAAVSGAWASSSLIAGATANDVEKLSGDLRSLAEKSLKLMGETGLIENWKSQKDQISGAFLFLDGQSALQHALAQDTPLKQSLKTIEGTLKIAAGTQEAHTPTANLLNFGIGIVGATDAWSAYLAKGKDDFPGMIKPLKSSLSPLQTLAESSELVPSFLPKGIGLLSAGLSGADAFHTYQDPKAKGAKKALKVMGAVGEITKAITNFLPAEQFGTLATGVKYFCLVVQVADKTYTLFHEDEGKNLLSSKANPF